LFGQSGEGIRATATGMAAISNATNCIRPWMIPDKWNDADGDNTYDAPPDSYTPPGYTLADVGTPVVFHPGKPSDAISPSDYYIVDVNPSCTGGNCYRDSINSCINQEYTIDQQLETLPGDKHGPTIQGVNDLIAQDPTATWNGTAVVNDSGADGGSPRIVPIAMFSPVEFSTLDRTSGRFWLTIKNLMGFFVQSVDGDGTVHGVLVRDAGDLVSANTPPGNAAFLRTPILVR